MGQLQKYFRSTLFGVMLFMSCDSQVSKQDKLQSDEMINGDAEILGLASQGSPEMMLYTENAILLDPKNSDAWRELSVPYLKRGMPLQWKPLFDKAVEENPKSWQGWRGYLYLYFYRNYKKAIEDFDATDILTPNFDDSPQGQSVNYMRGIAYLGLKEYKTSLKYFNLYINEQMAESGEGYVDVTAFLYRGIVNYELQNYDKAVLNFFKVLENSGGHYADAHYFLAKCFLAKKDNEKALLHCEKAKNDFTNGYRNERGYVEVLYQIYIQDIKELEMQMADKTEKE